MAELARLDMLRSEFWSGVRIYLEAHAAGIEPAGDDLPACFAHFMQRAARGKLVRLRDSGEDATRAAIDALGGHWPNGAAAPPLKW